MTWMYRFNQFWDYFKAILHFVAGYVSFLVISAFSVAGLLLTPNGEKNIVLLSVAIAWVFTRLILSYQRD